SCRTVPTRSDRNQWGSYLTAITAVRAPPPRSRLSCHALCHFAGAPGRPASTRRRRLLGLRASSPALRRACSPCCSIWLRLLLDWTRSRRWRSSYSSACPTPRFSVFFVFGEREDQDLRLRYPRERPEKTALERDRDRR